MKNAALSDDIIYHEYTHLVAASLGFNPTSDQTDQTRALSEAYADYFTATYTDDPRIGEWVVTCPDRAACVGPSNDAELRRLDLDPAVWNWKYGFPSDDLAYGFCLRYHTSDLKCKASNNNFTNPYVWGMIWASALWDLRNQLGPTVSNPLILAAIDKHTLDTDFITAARDLLEVDEDLFLGVNELVIRSVFRARGFILPLVNSVEEISSVAGKAVSVWPQPAQNEVHFSFISALPGAWSVSWYSLLGQRVRRTEFQPEIIGPQHITESVQDLTPGVYVVELTNGKRVETIQVVVVQ